MYKFELFFFFFPLSHLNAESGRKQNCFGKLCISHLVRLTLSYFSRHLLGEHWYENIRRDFLPFQVSSKGNLQPLRLDVSDSFQTSHVISSDVPGAV